MHALFIYFRGHTWLASLIVFFITFGTATYVVNVRDEQRLVVAQKNATQLAFKYAQLLERYTQHALSANASIAALVQQGRGEVANFGAIAHNLLVFYPDVSQIGLAPDGIINQIAAQHPGQFLGLDVFSDSQQSAKAIKARDTQQLTFSGVIKDQEGIVHMIALRPVHFKNSNADTYFWGFVYSLIKLPDLFREAKLSALENQGYSYRLLRNQQNDLNLSELQIMALSSTKQTIDPIEQSINLADEVWTLQISPQSGWRQPKALLLDFGIGFFVSLLLAWSAKRTLRTTNFYKNKIHQMGHFDNLTGLPNRAHLTEKASDMLAMAQKKQTKVAFISINLDNFKSINDWLGHKYGDQLLQTWGQRLTSLARQQDVCARQGSNNFMLVQLECDAECAARTASQLLDLASKPMHIGGHEVTITPSIGISIYPGDGTTFEVLHQHADAAMSRARSAGSNQYRFFTQEIEALSNRTLRLENALYRAIERNQLELHFQPQIILKNKKIVGAEALLRWVHPDFGNVSPAEFIPIAEENGLIVPLGEWVLRTAIRQLHTWLEKGIELHIAVNLSGVQFNQPELPQRIAQILKEERLSANLLELELTESMAMADPDHAIATLQALYTLGVQLAMDDFGTGYSSLSYLQRLPIHKLKIDQSFVRDIDKSAKDKAIVNAIISLAQALNLQTMAEGVETDAQLAFLSEQGCQGAQGNYFSRPLNAEEFEAFFINFKLPDTSPSDSHQEA